MATDRTQLNVADIRHLLRAHFCTPLALCRLHADGTTTPIGLRDRAVASAAAVLVSQILDLALCEAERRERKGP